MKTKGSPKYNEIQQHRTKEEKEICVLFVKTAWYFDKGSHFQEALPFVFTCLFAYVSLSASVCLLLAFKGCASLLWGSWGPACSSVQHRDSDTSCIHRHRPLPAFDVRSAAQPLTAETPRSYQICPVRRKREKKKKKIRNRHYSLLLTCFYYLTGKKKLFDIRGQKTSCSGLGTLGCLTDWLHGQSSQGLSLCPTAFQTAPGMREFCLRQKNDKLELHFTKSECLGLD